MENNRFSRLINSIVVILAQSRFAHSPNLLGVQQEVLARLCLDRVADALDAARQALEDALEEDSGKYSENKIRLRDDYVVKWRVHVTVHYRSPYCITQCGCL